MKYCRRKEGFWDGIGWGMESLVYLSGGKEVRVLEYYGREGRVCLVLDYMGYRRL